MVTAGTYRKEHFFRTDDRTRILHDSLLGFADRDGWRMEAWAVFANHYHFVAGSPEGAPDGAQSLTVFLADLHQETSSLVNEMDATPGRKVWHNFWETRLTYEKSYLARLSYVHQNAVKHGLVTVASEYPWCSAAWFERTATPAQVRTIYSFKTDRLKILDDF
jgi:putative transposase